MEPSPSPAAGGPAPAGGELRVLFIHPGPVPPHADPQKNALFHLSKHLHGDLITTWWEPSHKEGREKAVAHQRNLGRFRYVYTLTTRWPGLVRMVYQTGFYIVQGLLGTLRHGRYDAIVAYAPFKTGLSGYVLKVLTGAPLVIEVPVNPAQSFTDTRTFEARVKRKLADVFVPFLLRRADHVKLFFPGQIDAERYGLRSVSAFPNFVPLNNIAARPRPEPTGEDPYILTVGAPFHVKGVDILIRAFQQIADRYPRLRLKIVGHCPDLSPYRALAAGHPRIEFSPGVPHDEVLRLIAGCELFVLASRTEAVARVLMETMALRKPIVASAVDGTPFALDGGRAGLLFRSEDPEDLARQLTTVLDDPALAARLADEGHRSGMRRFSEEGYVEQFRQMLQQVVAPRRTRGALAGRPSESAR
jgi:glycosyltransferase involved in cell wall biosynthesis